MNDKIKHLRNEIEKTIGQRIQTPKDFQNLSHKVLERTNQLLSVSTLMRLWGYVEGNVNPRISTLNILANFLGYKSYEDFIIGESYDVESNPVYSKAIQVSTDLIKGDTVTLRWLPDRECTVEYLGDNKFRVIKAINSRLQEGDTFCCSCIIEGEPLFLGSLYREGWKDTVSYVCGKNNGVHFSR